MDEGVEIFETAGNNRELLRQASLIFSWASHQAHPDLPVTRQLNHTQTIYHPQMRNHTTCIIR